MWTRPHHSGISESFPPLRDRSKASWAATPAVTRCGPHRGFGFLTPAGRPTSRPTRESGTSRPRASSAIASSGSSWFCLRARILFDDCWASSRESCTGRGVKPDFDVGRNHMRIVGHRKTRPLTFSGSASLLAEGARFNDEIHRLPGGNRTFVRKGIYRFKTHDEANRHDRDCIAVGMARIAAERRS